MRRDGNGVMRRMGMRMDGEAGNWRRWVEVRRRGDEMKKKKGGRWMKGCGVKDGVNHGGKVVFTDKEQICERLNGWG